MPLTRPYTTGFNKMARRKIHEITHTTAMGTIHTIKVYRDPEWNEWINEYFINGLAQTGSDYATDSKQDALDTAQWCIDRLKKQFA